MRRLSIKWSTVSINGCVGVARVSDFFREDSILNISRFRIGIEQNYGAACVSSISPLPPNKSLPQIPKEEMELLHTMAKTFFSGVRENNSCFHWMYEDENKHSKEVVLDKE